MQSVAFLKKLTILVVRLSKKTGFLLKRKVLNEYGKCIAPYGFHRELPVAVLL